MSKWLDFQVFSDKDYKPEVPSHNSFNSKILWDVKEPSHLSKRVGHEVPGVVAAQFSKVAGSKYTCKRLRVYEATKKCVWIALSQDVIFECWNALKNEKQTSELAKRF